MSFDPEKAKEYCINKLKKGNEDVSEGRMRANMANKHIGSSAAELFDMPDSELDHLRDDLWKTDGSFERARQAHIEEMEEIYPKNNEYHSEGGTELQFTVHQERFLGINNMTIDLVIIPAIGYDDGQLGILFGVDATWSRFPCSEGNYEAL